MIRTTAVVLVRIIATIVDAITAGCERYTIAVSTREFPPTTDAGHRRGARDDGGCQKQKKKRQQNTLSTEKNATKILLTH